MSILRIDLMFEQTHFLETIGSNVADSEMRRTYNRKLEF